MFEPNAVGDIGVTLASLLVFFTGCNKEPPLGFWRRPEIRYTHHSDRQVYPTASTCDLILRFNVIPQDYENFKRNLVTALQCSNEFGLV